MCALLKDRYMHQRVPLIKPHTLPSSLLGIGTCCDKYVFHVFFFQAFIAVLVIISLVLGQLFLSAPLKRMLKELNARMNTDPEEIKRRELEKAER